MRKPFLASIALALQVAGPALAADVPVSPVAPVYSVVTPAVYSWWTGCYVGGNAGIVWSNVTYTSVKPVTDALGVAHVFSEDFGFTPSSYVGGLQLGCQYQWNSWVFGAEGTFSAFHLNQTHPDAILSGVRSINIDKIGTVTPRLGYTWGRTMLYFKGGWAGVRVNAHAADLKIANAVTSIAFTDFTQVNSGWTVGAGLEHVPWRDIIVGLGFDYYNVAFDRSGVDNFGAPFQVSSSRANIYAVTLRLSYLFGPPVVTNY
jgi:outer membrane immunogenic protein